MLICSSVPLMAARMCTPFDCRLSFLLCFCMACFLVFSIRSFSSLTCSSYCKMKSHNVKKQNKTNKKISTQTDTPYRITSPRATISFNKAFITTVARQLLTPCPLIFNFPCRLTLRSLDPTLALVSFSSIQFSLFNTMWVEPFLLWLGSSSLT